MAGDHRNSHARAALFDQEVADQRLRRRQQHAIRRAGCVLEAVVGAVHAYQHLDLVVIRREILVAHRPVEAEAVTRMRLEIVGAVAQRNAAPVIRAPPEHARAPPDELARRIVGRAGIGLTRNLPAAVDGCIPKAEGLLGCARTTQRRVGVGLEHRGFSGRLVIAARFEHQHLGAVHGERVRGLPAGRTGAHDDHVIGVLVGRLA